MTEIENRNFSDATMNKIFSGLFIPYLRFDCCAISI